jgi:hypothetical protein
VTGFKGTYEVNVTIGTEGPDFEFQWNAYKVPDRFEVYLPNGTRILNVLAGDKNWCKKDDCSSGCQGDVRKNDKETLNRPVGVSWVRLVVTGYCQRTGWQAKFKCPKPPSKK